MTCTLRRSAPPSSRWVAKLWRSTWGVQPVENAGLPAVSGQQLPETLPGQATAARGYKKVLAGAPLEQRAGGPFPGTPRPPEWRPCPPEPAAACCPLPGGPHNAHGLASRSPSPTRHSSETRSPVAYSNSSMARSRRPVGRDCVGSLDQSVDLLQIQELRDLLPLPWGCAGARSDRCRSGPPAGENRRSCAGW